MFYVILFVIALILAIIGFKAKNDSWMRNEECEGFFPWFGTLCTIIGCIFIVVIFIQAKYGYDDYRSILAKQSEITVLESNLGNIRNCYYPDSTKSATVLVKGSIENNQQSQKLFEYTNFVIRKKREYNNSVVVYNTNRESTYFWLFGYGLYMKNIEFHTYME